MRRRKEEVAYWERRIKGMFEAVEGSDKVENRYRALRYLLKPKYPQIAELPQETLLEILRDAVYLDRKLRKETEGNENELKEELSDDWKVENGYLPELKKCQYED